MPPRRLSHLALTALAVGVLIAAALFFIYHSARPGVHLGERGPRVSVAESIAAVSGRVVAPSAGWTKLSVSEQAALYPLQGEWDKLGGARQAKWLEIADRFPSMTQDERERTQQRMHEWVTLTPEQRRIARDSYVRAHALAPEKRAELLQKYQELPDQEKEHLAAIAREHRSVVAIKTVRSKEEPLPTKAQIKEGSEQRVPGVNPPANFAKPAPPVAVAPSAATTAAIGAAAAPAGASNASVPVAATPVVPSPSLATGAAPAGAAAAAPAPSSGQLAPVTHP